MARDLSRATDGGTVTTDQARERERARRRASEQTNTRASGRVLKAFAMDTINIAIAVAMLVAIYWLLGREFPGGTVGISALLGGLVLLDGVATAYDVWSG